MVSISIECEFCKSEFTAKRTDRRFCSRQCSTRWWALHGRTPVICKVCSKEFYSWKTDNEFCSSACRGKWNRWNLVKICQYCGKDFKPKDRRAGCCSNLCLGRLANEGIKRQLAALTYNCVQCGGEFRPTSLNARYCSDQCRKRQHLLDQRSRKYSIRKYGIEASDYDDLLEKQGGRCAICRRSPDGEGHHGRLFIDHIHGTKVIRGLLCGQCNVAIGMMKDDPDRLRAAIAYLEKHHGAEQD